MCVVTSQHASDHVTGSLVPRSRLSIWSRHPTSRHSIRSRHRDPGHVTACVWSRRARSGHHDTLCQYRTARSMICYAGTGQSVARYAVSVPEGRRELLVSPASPATDNVEMLELTPLSYAMSVPGRSQHDTLWHYRAARSTSTRHVGAGA
eukprot:289414-Rhodomonas_salina.2